MSFNNCVKIVSHKVHLFMRFFQLLVNSIPMSLSTIRIFANALSPVVSIPLNTYQRRRIALCLSAVVFLPRLIGSAISWVIVVGLALVSSGHILKDQSLGFLADLTTLSPCTITFLVLLVFKFLKVFVHTISYLSYRPIQKPSCPTLTSKDCTVIVPTVGDLDDEFVECIQSILSCDPAGVIVSTAGDEKRRLAEQVCTMIDPSIRVLAVDLPNKRTQVMAASKHVNTALTVLADDHVFWPPTFLASSLAPFESPKVGLLGTVKRARRMRSSFYSWDDLLNYTACLYLERHNFECTATSFINGSVFVISGRTMLLRTSIIQSHDFIRGYLNETWLWGRVGPLKCDDDNFITRWIVKRGFSVVFHNEPGALLETNLGTAGDWVKFRGQLDRWARTTWRSNSTSLFADRQVWPSQWWSVYAIHLSSFINFALPYDLSLFLTLYFSTFGSWTAMWRLALLLLVSKLIKPLPHYWRHPKDICYIPFGIAFGYWHGWVKFHALLTCKNIAWGTRKCVDSLAEPESAAGSSGLDQR
jgi:hypothetical protein